MKFFLIATLHFLFVFTLKAEKYTYESDENDSEIVHYKMLGGGHWWDYSLDENLKTSSLLWDFFSRHSKD